MQGNWKKIFYLNFICVLLGIRQKKNNFAAQWALFYIFWKLYANSAEQGIIFLKQMLQKQKRIYILLKVYCICKHFYRAQPLQY